MANARDIKKRIRSIKNIGQITRALEAVSASRVRKAQARVLASRAFAEKAWEILLNVQSTAKGTPLHPLLTPRTDVKNVMVILVTSDRGLAGAFNSNIIRAGRRFASRLNNANVRYVTVGRKGRDSLIRARENVVAEFPAKSEPTILDISPIVRIATEEFLSGHVDEVFVAYTDFINTLTQRPTVSRLLPLTPYETTDQVAAEYIKDAPVVSTGSLDYEYEPSPAAILEEIVPRFVTLQMYQAILESQASEHSARMVAMRNASDNSDVLVESFTLIYNKARQAGITAEILDIVGGAEALQATLDKAATEVSALAQFQAQELEKPREKPLGKPAGKKPVKDPNVDDLTKLEGIGPKISNTLRAAGFDTFEKLAEADESAIRGVLEKAGITLAPVAATWAKQAKLAAQGDWDGLERLKDSLTAGREA